MFSYNATNNSLPSYNCINPCQTMFSSTNGCNNSINNNTNDCTPSSCFRPLQQLYKTIYSSDCGNTPTNRTIACICRPAERYKTTNMSYGSFYYDNQISTQKDRVLNYDRAIFARCYDNNKRAEHQSKNNDPQIKTILKNVNYGLQQLMMHVVQSIVVPLIPITPIDVKIFKIIIPIGRHARQTTMPLCSTPIPSVPNKTWNSYDCCL
ncbi:hypothetical protein I4U23_029237 [Adineta vaga]|nr:hypothetical protein I4U23_029237 [Adineta vaga]